MQEQITIFIPSKGRAISSKFLKGLEHAVPNAFIIVFVEPQEIEKYLLHFPWVTIHELPANDQGICYARNYMKQFAKKLGLNSYWQVDDDINSFYERMGSKMHKRPEWIWVLEKAQAQFEREGMALGGLEYQQYAWSATKDMIVNSFCDVCVWTDMRKIGHLQYDCQLVGKTDRDMAIQTIRAGHRTGRTTIWAFGAPKNGSNAGGLKEIFYDQPGHEQQCVQAMVFKWGERICTPVVKPDGRHDVRINWKEINNKQQEFF